jgi:hypothetical protein
VNITSTSKVKDSRTPENGSGGLIAASDVESNINIGDGGSRPATTTTPSSARTSARTTTGDSARSGRRRQHLHHGRGQHPDRVDELPEHLQQGEGPEAVASATAHTPGGHDRLHNTAAAIGANATLTA